MRVVTKLLSSNQKLFGKQSERNNVDNQKKPKRAVKIHRKAVQKVPSNTHNCCYLHACTLAPHGNHPSSVQNCCSKSGPSLAVCGPPRLPGTGLVRRQRQRTCDGGSFQGCAECRPPANPAAPVTISRHLLLLRSRPMRQPPVEVVLPDWPKPAQALQQCGFQAPSWHCATLFLCVWCVHAEEIALDKQVQRNILGLMLPPASMGSWQYSCHGRS